MNYELKLLSLTQVMEITSLSKSTIYRLMNKRLFPLSLSIGSRRVAWRTDDISKWNKKLGRSK